MRVMITIESGPFPGLVDHQEEMTEAQVRSLLRRIEYAVQDEELVHVVIQLRAHDLDTGKEIDI